MIRILNAIPNWAYAALSAALIAIAAALICESMRLRASAANEALEREKEISRREHERASLELEQAKARKAEAQKQAAEIEKKKIEREHQIQEKILRGKQIDLDETNARRELAALQTLIYECNMAIVDQMTGFEFEAFIGKLLAANGYADVQVTQASGDRGADIIAVSEVGRKTCFQCKHYEGVVGVEAVQEVYAACRYYGCDDAAVITNSRYTRQAKELAEKIGVYLLDCDYISQLMHKCISDCVEAIKDPAAYSRRLAEAKAKFEEASFFGE